MVMTDAFTKLAVLRIIPNKLAATTATAFLEAWVYTFGVPKAVITDQGNEFKGLFDATLVQTLQSKHIATTPYHPQSNGQAEVFNRTLAHYLRTMIEDCQTDTLDWEAYIMPLQFAYNTSIHSTTMTTPFFAHFGYDPQVPLWKRKDKAALEHTPQFNDPVARVLQVNHNIHTHIRERLPAVRHTQDMQYNARHKTKPYTYKEGDRVWVERMGIAEPNPKLSQKWEEAIVLKVTSATNLRISRYNRKKNKTLVVHVDKVRPMINGTPPDTTQMTQQSPQTGIAEVDPRDMPILNRLYQGRATQTDVQVLLNKGYVVVFPHGRLLPSNNPLPGPRTCVDTAIPGTLDTSNNNDTASVVYSWQGDTEEEESATVPSERIPEVSQQYTSHKTQTPPEKDKLSRLAKQLAIPETSTFHPAEMQPGRQLRTRVLSGMATLHKVGGQILKTPMLVKDAYIRSGERELSRLSDAALEIFYKNQRKMEEKRQKEREKQAFYDHLQQTRLKQQQQRSHSGSQPYTQGKTDNDRHPS